MINKVGSISRSGNVQSTEASLSEMKSKNLESQLTSQQQRLNKISGDTEMSEQEKIKERQKIQQQIAELNRKLRLEQMKEEEKKQKVEKEQESKIAEKEELRQEEMQKDKESSKAGEEENIQPKEVSPKEVYHMLNVNLRIQQERVMENVERKKDSMENILETELKMDRFYSGENPVKEEQLSEMRRKKPIRIEALGVEETALGVDKSRKVVIKAAADS